MDIRYNLSCGNDVLYSVRMRQLCSRGCEGQYLGAGKTFLVTC